jgi:hypothetical protein
MHRDEATQPTFQLERDYAKMGAIIMKIGFLSARLRIKAVCMVINYGCEFVQDIHEHQRIKCLKFKFFTDNFTFKYCYLFNKIYLK